ncbi:DUF3300 domain-containing protein [Mesorhizobium sp. VK22B]|uniref:DUF3300 domain-containing protein n=1 Tax=Mesorhizobium captivum TaxID=3072319 RepID=A0ABU4Z7T6_9HYPH|nr:DUF3300 domain-containing protein [Mesorhizobium sp. VK22B]MDX8495334.1 DUF3300 domain-containing protein [Mesorhizobium sp. VK22B]
MRSKVRGTFVALALGLLLGGPPAPSAFAQDQSAAADAGAAAIQAPEPLSDDELQVLVARIALYPDEMVAVISEAALYPLQIVEASRFLDKRAKDPSLKPKPDWDGSVISLLNYPEIVKMMSDDIDWTQTLGDALTYQQKDVMIAIQTLRDKAVASGTIKSDDKLKVTKENDNVVIHSSSPEVIYVPQYQPQMLYAPSYAMTPVTYYPDPYPPYWYPTATFFAGAVTGAIWAAAVDWNNWGVWGGRWNGRDIDINCNNCFNNIKGKVNFNDVDWRKVDRSKIKIDKDQFGKLSGDGMRDRVKAEGNRNQLSSKAADIRRDHPNALPNRGAKVADIRNDKLPKPQAGSIKRDVKKPGGSTSKVTRPAAGKAAARIDRPVGKPRPAARLDNRPKNLGGLGNVGPGRREMIASHRGARSMGGGFYGGGRPNMALHRGGGRGGGVIRRGGGRR